MPTDPSTAPANATSRRTFLRRTALGGALASAAVVAGSELATTASAQARNTSAAKPLDDSHYANFAAPLELAAVEIYQSALDNKVVAPDSTEFTTLQSVQAHHQAAATALTTLLPTTATAPVPATGFSAGLGSAAKQATSVATLLATLAGVEDTLSATHLLALETIADPITAKMAAQILAAEAQTAAALSVAGGATVATVTPSVATPTGGITPGTIAGAPATTTTTTLAN